MRRSIAELCRADHRGDPALLAAWLSQQDAEIVAAWMRRADASYLVAIERAAIAAVGARDRRRRNPPQLCLRLMRGFAARAAPCSPASKPAPPAAALRQCTLVSTETARRFYRARGYERDRRAGQKVRDGLCGFPMAKRPGAAGGLAGPGRRRVRACRRGSNRQKRAPVRAYRSPTTAVMEKILA